MTSARRGLKVMKPDCAKIAVMTLKLSSYKGTRDLYPEDMVLRRYVFDGWRSVVESYGYKEYMAPLLEPIDVYAAKSGEEIVSEQTYSFTDRGGRQMVIRPEMTPSVSRLVAARRQEMPMPARLYSIANFMRYERPQHGREREFWQLNFDLFGDDSIYADAEIIEIADQLLRYFGASDEMFTIRLGDRRLTDYIMKQHLGLGEEAAGRAIKLLDKFSKMPRDKFDASMAEIIGDEALSKLNEIIDAKDIDDLPQDILANGVADNLRQLIHILRDERGISNVHYDPKLMRGFDYYTGTVFEVFDEDPENRRSLFGGGRYDGLVGLFGVEPLPVVGAAPGETMFIEFMRAHDLIPEWVQNGKYNFSIDYRIVPLNDEPATIEYVGEVAKELRILMGGRHNSVSVDYTPRKSGAKTKAAIKAKTDYIIYIGDDEARARTISVKDTASGEQKSYEFDNIDAMVHDVIQRMADRYVDEVNDVEEK